MQRRDFLRAAAFALVAPAGTTLIGCADETKTTGTTVELTPEDIKGFEAAEESYRAMEKGTGKAKKK